jgi:hypothetical protein
MFLPGSELQVPDAELGYRLKPGIRLSERFEPWRTGNLVLDGQLSRPPRTDGEAVAVELLTDAAGFCNDGVPEKCDIVATGDSFVGQSPVPREDYWSAAAAKKLGMSFYNLGVGGYGPQQELGVLKRYGLPKNPRFVLWGYFEGNDLRDAEEFAAYRASGRTWFEFKSKINFPYTRPVVRLAVVLVKALGLASAPRTAPLPPYPKPYELSIGGAEYPMSFDRWNFRTLTMSRDEIKKSAAWKETTDSLIAAKAACGAENAALVVVYLPDKFSVFADEVIGKFEKDKEKMFAFVKPALNESVLKKTDGSEITPEEFVEILQHNHDAQREALKNFCAKEGIIFIDTAPALRASVEAGVWPYYSYDTHLNIAGEKVVADAVAAYLGNSSGPGGQTLPGVTPGVSSGSDPIYELAVPETGHGRQTPPEISRRNFSLVSDPLAAEFLKSVAIPQVP